MVQLNIGRAFLDNKCPRHVLLTSVQGMFCFIYESNCFRYLTCYRGDMSILFKIELDNDTDKFSLEDSCDIFFIY